MKKADAVLQVRVNSEDKANANEILNHLGLDISTAVNMLLKQIVIQKRLPFSVTTLPEDDDLGYKAGSGTLEKPSGK